MSDINLEVTLDLSGIELLSMYSTDVRSPTKIDSDFIHVLNLSTDTFIDYGGVNMEIKGLRKSDNINWHLNDYSKYNSDLSAVIINYAATSDNYNDFISRPSLVTSSLDRPYVKDPGNLSGGIGFDKVNLQYWTSSILKLDYTDTYKTIVQIFRRTKSLGYASFDRTINLTK
ncbi:inclusion body family protein [Xenorhabdus bovienii]|uniref:AidA/PixA family protein n=1 Tax=Xenorhabdus bovienii TaxID=40576 RepID=UPI0023B27ED9|nr:AidA/PixA family protein [Xenorhabdus bovienii]MDE9557926.1 inclusion body family protein [Xenorhabdus bovienii]